MKANINLRDDLTKLSDAELAERLKANWATYEAAGVPPPGRFSLLRPVFYGFRGPVRNRRAYRFLILLQGSDGSWLSLMFAALLSGSRLERLLRVDKVADAHLSLCEIRDMMDEIDRRVKLGQRKP